MSLVSVTCKCPAVCPAFEFQMQPAELQCGRSYLLYGASAFNQDIGSWNVGSVTTLYQTFYSASAFNQNIGSWSTASVTTMYQACFLLRFGALMMCVGACRSYWVVGVLCSELEQHARCVGCACRCLGSAGHRCSSD